VKIAAEEEAPLGGEALARRRMDLNRAWRDLLHFEETMQSLVDRKDNRSVALLDGFLAQYMGQHLAPPFVAALAEFSSGGNGDRCEPTFFEGANPVGDALSATRAGRDR
jgi:hypothetical protein